MYLCRVTYYVEFLPRRMRGFCITLLVVWWAVGSMFSAALGMLVMPSGEWIQQMSRHALSVRILLTYILQYLTHTTGDCT